jgi:uncharacterized membrane protein YkvA (DUF1232 family)
LSARNPEEESVVIELNPRERRLYDRLRARVVKARPGAASGIRDAILLLPDLSVLLLRLLRDSRVAVLGVGYALSPIDLIPSLLVGPIGLVDHLLVVSAALSKILNQVHPDVVRSHWSGQGDALDAIQRAARWSASILVERIPRQLRGRD